MTFGRFEPIRTRSIGIWRGGGMPGRAEAILALDTERRAALTTMQEGQAQRNTLSKQIGQAKRTGGDSVALEAEATALRERMGALETDAARHEASIKVMLDVLPNRLDPAVPEGSDESGNVVVKQVGEPRQLEGAKEHFELGELLGMMEFEAATRMSGARFTILRGKLARMERALGQFMLDLHTGAHGYTEMQVPLLVNDDAAYGTDKLPKFADDLFKTTDGRWLIPTAEVPLTSMVMGQIVPEAELPLRMTALSECFRSEAGSAGRDTRGMLRQHQFRKVELVSITAPERSEEEHERMTACAEAVLEKLGLAYRRMLLCAGDTGFGAAKTFDLEVWLPGQKGLARDQFVFQYAGFSGTADECSDAGGRWEGRGARAYAERVGGRVGAVSDRGDGELSAAGGRDRGAGGAGGVYGRGYYDRVTGWGGPCRPGLPRRYAPRNDEARGLARQGLLGGR